MASLLFKSSAVAALRSTTARTTTLAPFSALINNSFHTTCALEAGHSKWKNIMHRKSKQDAKKAEAFTKVSKAITAAVRNGGGNNDDNFWLRGALQMARKANAPKSIVEAAIARAASSDHSHEDSLWYEGAGPGGSLFIVHALSDNKNRSAKDIRHIFSKHGGHLGNSGSAMFAFDHLGSLQVYGEAGTDEDSMTAIVEKISENELTVDVEVEMSETSIVATDGHTIEGSHPVVTAFCEPQDLKKFHDELEAMEIACEQAKLIYLPKTRTTIDDPEIELKVEGILSDLHADADVQAVFHNLE